MQRKILEGCRLKRWTKIILAIILLYFFSNAYGHLWSENASKGHQMLPNEVKQVLDKLFISDHQQQVQNSISNHTTNDTTPLDLFLSPGHPLHFPHRYLINEEETCSEDILIINIVPVAAHDLKARLMIRDLWGNQKYSSMTGMRTLFLLGITNSSQTLGQVAKESEIFHDILLLDFIDCYENLTLKTLSILHWVKNFCPSAQWVLKSDVDVFVNPFALSQFLENRIDDPDFVCIIHPRPKVCHTESRDCPSKWVIPLEIYPEDFYPPYCRGPAYIIHSGIVPQLYQAANKTHPFVMEDTYYTGILAEPLKPKYFNLNGEHFSFFPKDVKNAKKKLSFLLLNLEYSKKNEPPTLWNKVLTFNKLPRETAPGEASKQWSFSETST